MACPFGNDPQGSCINGSNSVSSVSTSSPNLLQSSGLPFALLMPVCDDIQFSNICCTAGSKWDCRVVVACAVNSGKWNCHPNTRFRHFSALLEE